MWCENVISGSLLRHVCLNAWFLVDVGPVYAQNVICFLFTVTIMSNNFVFK
jgi:hypothetical protein